MYIRFLGAIGTVTGSMTEIYHPDTDRHFLVDCGVMQGENPPDIPDWTEEPLPFSPSSLDFIILTHAHLDHVGLLPELIRQGFDGTIWCTEATRDLTRLAVKDSLKIENADDAEQVLDKLRFKVPDPGFLTDRISLADGLTITFLRNAHIVGACTVQLSWLQDEDWRSIAFAGDIGINREDDAPLPLLAGRQTPYPADYTVLESTYGNRCREPMDRSRRLETFRNLTRSVVEESRIVILPCFAIQRAQEVLFDLYHARLQAPASPSIPLIVHSPMLQRASNIIADHLTKTELKQRSSPDADPVRYLWMNQETAQHLGVDPYTQQKLLKYLVETALTGNSDITISDESLTDWGKGLDRHDNPYGNWDLEKLTQHGGFVVASAGMCSAGPILKYLYNFLDNERTTVALTGFCAPETLGAKLLRLGQLDQERREQLPSEQTIALDVEEEKVINVADIQAEIFKLTHYSGHTDQQGLIDWLTAPYSRVDADADLTVYLVHGTDEGRKGLRDEINRRSDDDTLSGIASVDLILPSDVEQWYDLNNGGVPCDSPPIPRTVSPTLETTLDQLVPYDHRNFAAVEDAIDHDLLGPVRHTVSEFTSHDIQDWARRAWQRGSFTVLDWLLDQGATIYDLGDSPVDVLEAAARRDASDAIDVLCPRLDTATEDLLEVIKTALTTRSFDALVPLVSQLKQHSPGPRQSSELLALALLNHATKLIFDRLFEFGVQPDFRNAQGFTLLHIAAIGLRPASRLQALINAGIDPTATTPDAAHTSLHLTAIGTGFNSLQYWIDKDGPNYTQQQRNQRASKMAGVLLDAAPRLPLQQDASGRTALHYSANIGSHGLSMLLAEHTPETLLTPDDVGWRPAELTRVNGYDELAEKLEELQRTQL